MHNECEMGASVAGSNVRPISVCRWQRSVKVARSYRVMLFKWLYVSLLILVIQDSTGHMDIDYIDVAKYNMAYYNLTTRQGLEGEVENNIRQTLSQAKISFRGMGCNCNGLTCGCCAGVNLTAIKFDRRACTNFTYVPDDFAIKLAIAVNERIIYANSLSAKNPPPLCVPFSYLPIVNFCVRFFDVYTPGQNLHACIDFETRIVNWPILILHFNCVKMGVDGVSWTKPEDGSNVLQTKPDVSEPEVYDEVDFEQESELPTNQTSNLTPEQEENIGQLKL